MPDEPTAPPSAPDEESGSPDEESETPAEEAEASRAAVPLSRSPLSRDSDFIARPGFRPPANARSKAMKKKGKKRR